MNLVWKKTISMALILVMLLTVSGGYAETAAQPTQSQELGSGDVKWTETDMPDGWTKVENEGGATLGYSKSSGMQLVQVDGYAFKDLNRNGVLDTFEDWRVDFEERARALAYSGELSTELMMGLKMTSGVGAANAKELDENTITALNLGYRHIRFPKATPEIDVGWNNLMQAYIESLTDVVFIPATYMDDPLSGRAGTSWWPGYLGIAASFDPTLAAEYGEVLSKDWRALGVTMKIAPQIDLATEPRWKRTDLTFGEDPQLAMDMARAMVNGWQSSYDEEGNDLGWGKDSVNCQIKHLTGDGAAESGRESHSLDGAYTVFPGGQFYTQLLPFIACLDLPGKTETVSCAMTNFSIAVDGNGDSIGGERVATSFNKWKINELWRGALGFDGYILTDWSVHNSKYYGVEELTIPERLLKVLDAGNDGFGNFGGKREEDIATAMEVYMLGVEEHGKEAFDEIMKNSTRRILKTLFNVGYFENPYLDLRTAQTVPNNPEHAAAAFDAQVRSIVMLKNSDVIKQATEEKQTVYIPWKFTASSESRGKVTPASFSPAFDLVKATKYFNVVTDKPGDPTGPADADGKATVTAYDIVRASAEEIAACDFALVRIKSPQNGNPTTGYAEDGVSVPEDYEYLPISLQYRPYTADNMYVRVESIGGQIIAKEVQGTYGMETVYEKENRSYFGKTGIITNEADLDYVLYASSVSDKVVVCADVKNTMIFSEFESEVDAILVAWAGDRAPVIDDAAFLEVVAGNVEPSGLLPMQMPASMETVEAQFEDVPRDMECHVDSNGNTYDFAFGMNWSGVINDERVAKYNVPPIVGENPFLQ